MPYRTSLQRESGPGYSVITNTGYNNQVIFRSHEDFHHFILLIKRGLRRSPSVRLLAFSALPDSYSLVLYETEPRAIAAFMHRFGVAYGAYFNVRYQRHGKVFHGPYKDTQLVTDDEIMRGICRVHQAAAAADEELERYPWSSYGRYLNSTGSWIDKSFVARYFKTEKYSEDLRRITPTLSR